MLQVNPPLHSVPGNRLVQGLSIKVYQGISMQLHHMLQQLDKGLEAQESQAYYVELVLNFLKSLGVSKNKNIEVSSLSSHEFLGFSSPNSQLYINIQAPDDRTHMMNSRSLNRLSFYELMIQAMESYSDSSPTSSQDQVSIQFLITNLYEWYIFPFATLIPILQQAPELVEYYQGHKAGKPACRSIESLYRLIDQSHELFPIQGTYFNLYGIKEGLGKFDKVIQDRIIPLCLFLGSLYEGKDSLFSPPLLVEKELGHLLGLEKVPRSDLPYYRTSKTQTNNLLTDSTYHQRRMGLSFLHRSMLQQFIGNEGLIQLEKGRLLSKKKGSFVPNKVGMYPYPATACPNLENHKPIPPLSYWERIQHAHKISPHFRLALRENNYVPVDAGVWTSIWLALNREKSSEPLLAPDALGPWIGESLRKLVVQNFNKKKRWTCENWVDLKRKVAELSVDETREILLSIKVCDPAAGNGQMLLLILHELCCLFADLGCLKDAGGKRLFDIQFKRVDWAIHPIDSQGNLIEYPTESLTDARGNFARQIHTDIFQIKWDIIHFCLYGICPSTYHSQVARNALLLSLLSNRYQYPGKQTMKWVSLARFSPNIYSGNPLLSIRPIQAYSGEKKWASLVPNDPRQERLKDLKGKLQQLQQPMSLWDTPTENNASEKGWDIQRLSEAIETLEAHIQDPDDFWGTYLDWRELFPFLWTEKGDFLGFDAVFSAPPAIGQDDFQAFNPYLKNNFASYKSQANFYLYVMEIGIRLLRPGGKFGFISPDKWQQVQYADKFRMWLGEQSIYTSQVIQLSPSGSSIQLKHPLLTSGIRKYPVERIGA